MAYTAQFGSSGSGNGQFSNPYYGSSVDSSGNVYITDSGNNRIEKFDLNGNYLMQFGSAGTSSGKFSSPYGVAVDSSGNIYVADAGNNRVQKFNSSGTYVSQFGTFGSGNGQMGAPTGIAVDSSGNVYVADNANFRVEKFDSSGAYVTQFGGFGSSNGKFQNIRGLAIDANYVYAIDQDNNHVEKFTTAGTFVSEFGSSQLSSPKGIAVDSSGNVYVVDANNHISMFTTAGTYHSALGSAGSGNGQFNNPTGIAVNSSGNALYILDTGNNRVEKFAGDSVQNSTTATVTGGPAMTFTVSTSSVLYNGTTTLTWAPTSMGSCVASASPANGSWSGSKSATGSSQTIGGITATTTFTLSCYPLVGSATGQFVSSSGSGNGQFSAMRDIAVDAGGNIYVVDSGNSRVQILNSSGVYQWQFGSAGSSTGKFSNPIGIAVDTTGNIYVVDMSNYRVQKFNSSGTYLNSFGSYGSSTGQFITPNRVAVDSSGNVYVTDANLNRVEKFNASGVYQLQIGSSGSGSGQFSGNGPRGIAVDSSGNVYVADQGGSRIEKFSSSGTYLSSMGSYGSSTGQFGIGIGEVAVDSSDNVYAIDGYNYNGYANDRVEKFDSSGNFINQFSLVYSGNPATDSPYGTTITPSGNVLINYPADYLIAQFPQVTASQVSNIVGVPSAGVPVATSSSCVASQTNGPASGAYANKKMTWTVSFPGISGSITSASIDWSGTNISAHNSNGVTSEAKIYTTVGSKSITASSTVSSGGVTYTSSCTATTTVKQDTGLIKEI